MECCCEGCRARSKDPLKFTKIIKKQVGEVKYARILNNGNLLIGCSSEEQVGKALKMLGE